MAIIKQKKISIAETSKKGEQAENFVGAKGNQISGALKSIAEIREEYNNLKTQEERAVYLKGLIKAGVTLENLDFIQERLWVNQLMNNTKNGITDHFLKKRILEDISPEIIYQIWSLFKKDTKTVVISNILEYMYDRYTSKAADNYEETRKETSSVFLDVAKYLTTQKSDFNKLDITKHLMGLRGKIDPKDYDTFKQIVLDFANSEPYRIDNITLKNELDILVRNVMEK